MCMACEALAKDAGAHADEVILLYLDMLPDYVSLLVLIKGVPSLTKTTGNPEINSSKH